MTIPEDQPIPEASNKSAPSFNGVGPHQDPLKFLEDFYEAASWNNWISEGRRKELFLQCMTGYAREWFNNNVDRTSEAYNQLSFDKEDNAQSLVGVFKAQFVTPDWITKYQTTYRDRKQQLGESAWEYLNMKRALYARANTCDRLQLTEAQIVTDLRLGLSSSHARFIDAWENNPLVGGANKKVNTYKKLEEVLRWAEMYPAIGMSSAEKTTARDETVVQRQPEPVYAVMKRREQAGEPTVSATERLILEKLSKLEVLDRIEQDLAITMDRLDILERGRNRPVHTSNARGCFGCGSQGHYARECRQPCGTCVGPAHSISECRVRGKMAEQARKQSSPDFQDSLLLH